MSMDFQCLVALECHLDLFSKTFGQRNSRPLFAVGVLAKEKRIAALIVESHI